MSTLKQKYEALDAELRDEVLTAIREAIYHMASCWDYLREAEGMLEGEIETDQIDGITSSVDDPEDAYDIKEADLLEVLDGIEVG